MTRLHPSTAFVLAALLTWAGIGVALAHDDFYEARITACWDGDTCTADIDLGLGAGLSGVKLRLFGIDTPELRGPEREAGIAARDWLRGRVVGRDVVLQAHGRGKFGRLLATLWAPENINAEMLRLGLAREYGR